MATSRVDRGESWINSFDRSFARLGITDRLKDLGIWWNGAPAETLLHGLLAALWMRARSVSQAIALAGAIGDALPKKGTYRFLGQRYLDLRRLLRSFFTAKETTIEDIILVDDTPSKRTGFQLPGVSFIHSSTQKARVLGYSLVTLFHYGRQISGFMDFEVAISKSTPDQAKRRGRPHDEILRAKRTSKYDFVLEMLRRAKDVGNRARTVVFDSWYSQSVEFLWNVLLLRFHFITPMKSSRCLEFEGQYTKITRIWRRLKRFRRHDHRTRYRAFQTTFRGFTEVTAVFVKFTDCHGRKRRAVLIASDLNWSPTFIIDRYLDRSTIEQGYKNSKQDLGLSDAHLGTFWGQINEMALTFLAYLLASTVRLTEGCQRTITAILLEVRSQLPRTSAYVILRELMRLLKNHRGKTMIPSASIGEVISKTMMNSIIQ